MLRPETIEKIHETMVRAGLREEDLQEQFILGAGPGGQKTNKTSSVVRLVHVKSGLQVKFGRYRSREMNRLLARRALAEAILEKEQGVKSAAQQEREKIRRQKRRRSRRQKEKMLQDKHALSEKKIARRKIDYCLCS